MTDLSPGEYSTVTNDGFSVSSNTETADAITENLASEPKPKDGEPADPNRVAKIARMSICSIKLNLAHLILFHYEANRSRFRYISAACVSEQLGLLARDERRRKCLA